MIAPKVICVLLLFVYLPSTTGIRCYDGVLEDDVDESKREILEDQDVCVLSWDNEDSVIYTGEKRTEVSYDGCYMQGEEKLCECTSDLCFNPDTVREYINAHESEFTPQIQLAGEYYDNHSNGTGNLKEMFEYVHNHLAEYNTTEDNSAGNDTFADLHETVEANHTITP